MALPFSTQRTLIVAPHPDDDVIAAGGLIQRVVATGGDLRLLFVTDGENNPWPQRFLERKWFLGTADRTTWGAMRRREALCSLARLGIGERSATFLALPDQRLATLARRGDPRLPDALQKLVSDFQPTLIVSPSTFDLHPDHRAISYFTHAAAADVPLLTYVVHGHAPAERLAQRIELTEIEQRRKREAIECHSSQLVLSHTRFLSYVRPVEWFYAPEFELVRVESAARQHFTMLLHALRVVFGTYPDTAPCVGTGFGRSGRLKPAATHDPTCTARR